MLHGYFNRVGVLIRNINLSGTFENLILYPRLHYKNIKDNVSFQYTFEYQSYTPFIWFEFFLSKAHFVCQLTSRFIQVMFLARQFLDQLFFWWIALHNIICQNFSHCNPLAAFMKTLRTKERVARK